jgi:hypothetical protein
MLACVCMCMCMCVRVCVYAPVHILVHIAVGSMSGGPPPLKSLVSPPAGGRSFMSMSVFTSPPARQAPEPSTIEALSEQELLALSITDLTSIRDLMKEQVRTLLCEPSVRVCIFNTNTCLCMCLYDWRCRARVPPQLARTPHASPCSGDVLASPASHACGCASPVRACVSFRENVPYTVGYLCFGPMAQCVVHALKGLACRARPSRAR